MSDNEIELLIEEFYKLHGEEFYTIVSSDNENKRHHNLKKYTKMLTLFILKHKLEVM